MHNALRPILKHLVVSLYSRTGLFEVQRFFTGKSNTIFTFHRISKTSHDRGIFDSCPRISVEVFRQVIELITSYYQVLPLRELFEKGNNSRHCASITFDDGWVDNYTLAFPILQRFGVPATIFMTTGKVGSDEPFWQQKLGYCFQNARAESASALRRLVMLQDDAVLDGSMYVRTIRKMKKMNRREIGEFEGELKKHFEFPKGERIFLDEEEIREMSLHGMEFGSHTVNHIILTNESKDIIESELAESKKQLEDLTGKVVDKISYPNGDVTSDIVTLAERIGYRYGCSTEEGRFSARADRMMLPRNGRDFQAVLDKRGTFREDYFRWFCR